MTVSHRFGALGRVSVRIGGHARVRPLSKIGETAKQSAIGQTSHRERRQCRDDHVRCRRRRDLARSTRPDQDVSGRIAQLVIAPGADLEADGHTAFDGRLAANASLGAYRANIGKTE